MRDLIRRVAVLEALAKPKQRARRLRWRVYATGEAMVVAHYLGDPALTGFDRLYSGIENAGPFGYYTGNLSACFNMAVSAATSLHAIGEPQHWRYGPREIVAAFQAIPLADKCTLFAALRSLPRIHPELVWPLRDEMARGGAHAMQEGI